MCGILGGNKKSWNYEEAINTLQHRGPDRQKVMHFHDFTFAFARLSIIDLSDNAMQPMCSPDEKVSIVFNGEIYGYKAIRMELIKKGYLFKSTSDTEVILNAYLEWGEKFIDKIDGMFAIAIYDKRDSQVRLYRDRFGIKPLYYYENNGHFAFASELKGIIKLCNNQEFCVDNTALYDYNNYLYIPEPKTMYKKVYKLPPAYRMVYDIKKHKIVSRKPYWILKINPYQGRQRKEKDLIDELKYLIEESVKEQIVADVPIGTFLSGGVDSSVITYESSRLIPNLETFSIGFADRLYNELPFATLLANKLQVTMNQKIFNKDIFQKLYHQLPIWYDEPFADNSAFPTYLVSELAKKKVTVVLTGDGGDEIFGGYPRYLDLKKEWNHKGINNKKLSYLFEGFNRSKLFYGLESWFMEELALLLPTYQYAVRPNRAILRKKYHIPNDYDDYWHMRKYYNNDLPPITRCQYLDLKTYLPGDILTKVDRVSMAVSLETRVPLLTRRIAEFSFGLSEEDRCQAGELKGLLKKCYIKEIGKKLLYRNKKGFSVPIRFLKQGISPQEEMLCSLWNL